MALGEGTLQTDTFPHWPAIALVLLAFGLQFQSVLPIGSAGLEIWLADAVAAFLAAGMVIHRRHDGDGPLSRSRTLVHWLVICTTVLAASVAIIVLVALAVLAISPASLIRSVLYALACGLAFALARDVMIWIRQLHDAAKVENIGAFGTGLPPLLVNPPELALHDTTNGSSDFRRVSNYSEAFEPWLTAVVGMGWAVTRSLFSLRAGNDHACFRLAAVLMPILFAIIYLAHEMLYQRFLWLMLGLALALAIPRAKADTPCAD